VTDVHSSAATGCPLMAPLRHGGAPENVRLLGKTGSDRHTAKVTRLTLSRHCVSSRAPDGAQALSGSKQPDYKLEIAGRSPTCARCRWPRMRGAAALPVLSIFAARYDARRAATTSTGKDSATRTSSSSNPPSQHRLVGRERCAVRTARVQSQTRRSLFN
jgi:hypothetical protein